jgi:hypothetical protein
MSFRKGNYKRPRGKLAPARPRLLQPRGEIQPGGRPAVRGRAVILSGFEHRPYLLRRLAELATVEGFAVREFRDY